MRSQELLEKPSDLCPISSQVPKLELEVAPKNVDDHRESLAAGKSPKAVAGIRTSSEQDDVPNLEDFGLDCTTVDQSRIWTFEEQFRQVKTIQIK